MNHIQLKDLSDEEDSKSNEIKLKHIDLDMHNDDDLKQTNEDHFEIDHYGRQMHRPKTQFMSMPIKPCILSTFLLVTGVSFIIAGMASLIGKDENSKIISFLVFGCVLAIPGVYYTLQLCQAYIAETPEEREDILDDIPA